MSKYQIPIDVLPLMIEAKAKKLWLFSQYQQLWFSPTELADNMKKGQFLWGAENWELRNPQERLNDISKKIMELDDERMKIQNRIRREG